MSLRTKLVLILAGVIALYAGIHLAIQARVVFPSFLELEERQAQDDLHRVVDAIHNEVEHLDTTCHDWSAWDDTYDFIQTANAKFVEGNLQSTSLESANVHVMYFVRLDGVVVHRAVRDPAPGEEPFDPPEFPTDQRPEDDPLRCVDDEAASITGVLVTGRGPMLISSRPIVKSNREGPIQGFLVMGRLLDAESVGNLVDQTRVTFALWPLSSLKILPPAARSGLAALASGVNEAILERDEHALEAFATVADMHNRPAVLVQAEIPRDLMSEGARAVTFALWSAVGAGVLVLCVLASFLQRTVVDPLARLTAHAVAIGRDDDLETRLSSARRDEVGVLSRELDAMCDKLARSRAEHVDSARVAGMSEVATDVLHNVGNVLNSVNVSAGVIGQTLAGMRTGDLARVSVAIETRCAELGAGLAQDAKGRQTLDFLALLSVRLEEERGSLVRESAQLFEGLEHIHELVRAQQDLAGRSEALESVSLAAVIESAVLISGAEAGGSIEIVREVAAGPKVRIQKHKLLQILINLFKNARESVVQAGVARPRIAVRVETAPEGAQVRIRVTDNGVGIPADRLVSIFAHGRSTKPGGHGFGLHGSSNAAREMGGVLTAASAGPGQGATFTLDLPEEREARAA